MSWDPARREHAAWIWIYRLVVLYFIGLRLWFDFAVNPMGDEAYYWIWGQHPQWSFFDHPPLHAWLLGIVASVLGWSPFALRILTLFTLAGSLGILWGFARRLAPDNTEQWFWKSAAIFMTMPVVFIFTTPAFHDHLLAFLMLASCFCALEFALRMEADRRVALRWFYAAAVLAGLATLTKYNGILLAFGLAAFLVIHPRLRRLWATPHPYLAVLVIAAIQLPVLIWNVQEQFATLTFHFIERPDSNWSRIDWLGPVKFLLLMAIPLGPFFLIGAVIMLFRRPVPEAQRTARVLAISIFAISTLCLATVALYRDIFLHWNIAAFMALAAIGPMVIGRKWLLLPQIALALYMGSVAGWNYAVVPMRSPIFYDPGTAANYGWPEVGEAVREATAAHPGSILAATRYTYAAQLAFALHDPQVTAFNPLPSQYDFWWNADANRGRDAIVVADRLFNIDFTASQFAKVTKLDEVQVMRADRHVWTFDIYLAEDYDPAQPD
ncbi:MAG: hypothetical protein EOP22_00545 [Hyphomicrobiales bacterium]|nr:MAG: hypothetical protein EOP22_00545 [Hyphomicrobiales bacterium]